jgi:hydroxyethylthiazole kinase-like uncharacterized protein yjeF
MPATLLTAWRELQKQTLSVQQIRDVDRTAIDVYGMHSLVLMENAALGCVNWLQRKFPTPQSTTILCGSGNNGGDGLAIARHLTNAGWPCTVIQLGPLEKLSADARSNYEILTRLHGLPVRVTQTELTTEDQVGLRHSSLIIDALLGTGASCAPRWPLAQWLECANSCTAFRLAIDVPSGVDAQTGLAASMAFKADATLTFVARKTGMARTDADSVFGVLEVLPIGIPAQLILDIILQADQTEDRN